MSNAISLLTPLVAGIGTACIVLVWCLVHLILPSHHLSWVFGMHRISVKKPGIQPTGFAIGMVLLLWLPSVLKPWQTPPPPSPDKGMSGGNTAEEHARPWVSIDDLKAGPLIFSNSGAGIQLKITMKNSGPTPAINVLPFPMIFVQEAHPFSVIEIIKRRCPHSHPGGGLGYSLFPGQTVEEVNTPSMTREEFAYSTAIAPFLLICVKYKDASNNEIRRTASLYSLVRVNPAYPGQAFVITPLADGQAPAHLLPLGSHAD